MDDRDATPLDAIAELEGRLGYRFASREVLERALTHRSFSHECGGPRRHYERLEFLGDALLGFVVSDWLWRDDPAAAEGILSRRKQAVVRAETLASVARSLGVGEALQLGRGEEATGGRSKSSLLADAFEAILGAIYVDGGLDPSRSFVLTHLGPALEGARQARDLADDYKTRLQEETQRRIRQTPRYRIASTTGPAHEREFGAEVLIEDEVRGRGVGSTRKQAEQEAAREALERLREERD